MIPSQLLGHPARSSVHIQEIRWWHPIRHILFFFALYTFYLTQRATTFLSACIVLFHSYLGYFHCLSSDYKKMCIISLTMIIAKVEKEEKRPSTEVRICPHLFNMLGNRNEKIRNLEPPRKEKSRFFSLKVRNTCAFNKQLICFYL